jgi:hypothetical protein
MIIEGVFHRGEDWELGNYLKTAMYLFVALSGGLAIVFFAAMMALGALRLVGMIF